MKEPKTLYRLPPCPAYDVEGTESWLGDMAKQGWMLASDGIFCGVAQFERAEPQTVRYRMAAARESTSIWADGSGRPDEEQVETGAALGWEYVANRGEFYIFRTADPAARELDTDPQVQALALEAVRNRQWRSLNLLYIWTLLFPLSQIRGTVFLTALELGTPLALGILGTVLWCWLAAGREYFHLRKLKKRLEAGEPLEHKANWQKKRRWYWGMRAARWGAALLVIGMCTHAWAVWDEGEIPMAEYGGTPPFATLVDLAGEGAVRTGNPMPKYNTVREWSDPLAPVNIYWTEHGGYRLADGTDFDGMLYVYYHRAASPWVAQRIAQEYRRKDCWRSLWDRGRDRELDCPDLGADWAVAYQNFFPTVVFRKGNVVVRACVYGMPLEEWAPKLADSIG